MNYSLNGAAPILSVAWAAIQMGQGAVAKLERYRNKFFKKSEKDRRDREQVLQTFSVGGACVLVERGVPKWQLASTHFMQD